MGNSPALTHLSSDPVMKKLLEKHKIRELDEPGDLFVDIVENILGQQLSGKAADTITERFVALFKSKTNSHLKDFFPSAKEILAMPDEKIRGAGTSWAKVSYIKNFSQAVVSGTLDLEALKTQPDEIVVSELVKIKGIGQWTAEMVLIFYLRRPDIFSLGDQGLRNAVSLHYGVDKKDLKKIEKISRKWSPHRSLASRYLWESLNNR